MSTIQESPIPTMETTPMAAGTIENPIIEIPLPINSTANDENILVVRPSSESLAA